MSRSLMRRAFALLALALLAGCGRGVTSTPGDAPNLEEWVANVRARPAPALEPLPVLQQGERFEYCAQGLRDPFTDVWANPQGGSGLRPDPNRRKEPLEAFPLDSLDMVGTIGAGGAVVAVVMAPDKVSYRVRPGVYMGQSEENPDDSSMGAATTTPTAATAKSTVARTMITTRRMLR